MSILLIVLIVGLTFVVVLQVSKIYEYLSILNGRDKSQKQANKLNAIFMMLFLILGFIGIYFCHNTLKHKLLPKAASIQGATIDHMIWVTLIITGIVFLATQIMLFYFAYRFRARPGHSATYFSPYSPQNTKLEIIWTTATLVALLILVVIGLKQWFRITGPAPKNAMLVEITGQQFTWTFRYPGKDGELGKINYTFINAPKNNPLGQDWSDKANKDDIVSTGTLHLVVNRPVKFIIHSQDVIHDVGLPYFRVKMDAVPGVPTTLWLTPTITTSQMKKITADSSFVYELACDQLCGDRHFVMRSEIIVETSEQFNQWEAKQKPQYQLALPSQRSLPDRASINQDVSGKPPGKAIVYR